MAEKWTQDDEEKFTRMAKRRESVLTERRAVLSNAIAGMLPDVTKASVPMAPTMPGLGLPAALPADVRIGNAIVDGLIANADAIRDALAPYDSGMRAAPRMENEFVAAGWGQAAITVGAGGVKMDASHERAIPLQERSD